MTAPDYSASVLESLVGKIVAVDAARRNVQLESGGDELWMTYAPQLGESMGSLRGSRVIVTFVPPSTGKGLPRVLAVKATGDDGFWKTPSLEELEAAQGVKPIQSILDMRADFWPEGESVDEFLAAAMRGRGAYPE